MNWRTISASTILAASLLVPLSSIAASFNQSQTSSSYNVQTIAQTPNDDMPFKKRWGKGNKEQRLQRMQQELGLDDNQTSQIKAIHEQAKQDTQGLRQEMRQAKEEMGKLMASDASDTELRQQYRKMQGIRQQLSRKRFEKKLAVRKVLTTEQRTKMAELKQQRRQRWHGRRSR